MNALCVDIGALSVGILIFKVLCSHLKTRAYGVHPNFKRAFLEISGITAKYEHRALVRGKCKDRNPSVKFTVKLINFVPKRHLFIFYDSFKKLALHLSSYTKRRTYFHECEKLVSPCNLHGFKCNAFCMIFLRVIMKQAPREKLSMNKSLKMLILAWLFCW